MSELLHFEKNIEQATAAFFTEKGIEAIPTREATNLGTDPMQVVFDYNGAMEETRQHRSGALEYDTHSGVLMILIMTYRDSPTRHLERIGKVRQNLLNSNHGLTAADYKFIDIQPLGSTTSESEETNQNTTTMQYEIKFSINLRTI